MAAGGVRHPDWDVQLSGNVEKYREDGHNGIPSLPGSGYPVGGSLRALDDGRGSTILIEAESQGELFGVWGGNGGGVAGIPSTYTAWEISGRDTAIGEHVPRRRSTNIQDGLSNRGPPEELSSQGMLGTGGNTDGDEGIIPPPTCQGHCDHNGGGKTPPYLVTPV